LHTNDAPSTINRLVDIGLPAYLVTASLKLIIAQRLARKLCPHCKEPYEIDKVDLPEGVELDSQVIYRPKGCDKCNSIGYKGRTIISEVILLDEETKRLIHQGATPPQIMESAKKKGSYTLLESGLKRVTEGITSLEEVISIAAAT
jgi:type II secretory ATPase GspE/PulE/Tfp pilus assembly ATPase PilB-like protein